jgi:hypothetical protein
MRKTILFLCISLFYGDLFSQVTEMNWQLDYQIYLKLANDSNFTYDIREAFHVKEMKGQDKTEFIFYPVNPSEEYANELDKHTPEVQDYSTLWGALHNKLGGGWIHFINCIAYSLETMKLDLKAPLMVRPESNWKPKPVTDSYKRTKSWEYYVPFNQKDAQKEYKNRLTNKNLGDLSSLPEDYISLFLNTSQKEYNSLLKKEEFKKIAKIDLVKVILGANYLGEAQITYISNAVLEAVLTYSSNRLPSIIIFDEYDAAAAMSLNADGYKIDKIVYKPGLNLSEKEEALRLEEINRIISKINEYNLSSFKKRLGNYYQY